MAKNQWLTPHQKGIVKRYYENRDDAAYQKLSEAVSELYVCEDQKKAQRLWKGVRTALVNAGVHAGRAESVVEARDLGRLARIVGELS
ncbi:MAG: hypothetical protein J7M08_08805 [Planctomycetes bacterium]|nr:hypothetical protein [Planctomycetota bacterium]